MKVDDFMVENKTQMFAPKPMRRATLFIIDATGKPKIIELRGDATIGRDYAESDRDIRIVSSIVGRKHGELFYDNSRDSYYYIDNNSLNGTYINGRKLEPYNDRGSKAVLLRDGDIIRIDRSDLKHPHPQAVLMIFSRSFDVKEKWHARRISGLPEVTIGRSEGNTIRVDDNMASRHHASIRPVENSYVLSDMGSQNGVFVNQWRINGPVYINNNDVIRIANITMIYTGDTIIYNNPGERSGSLSVNIRDKTVGIKRKTLIKDIKFEVDTGDFVLILGGSGAGKTTLVNAILGDGKANADVMLNGQSLYDDFKSLKAQIGLVPQFIVLRENDKVIKTLVDVADVKLPGYSKEEKLERIDKILNLLGVSGLKNHLIRQLSGGQKKKISVAVQLIGYQKVFICDEPDSGLDAASRMQQMEILHDIAQNGKIVLVISHEPDDAYDRQNQVYYFTKILVIAKSNVDNCGHMAFFGTPDEAVRFFGVSKLQDIMIEINPEYEGGKGRADYYINKYRGVM